MRYFLLCKKYIGVDSVGLVKDRIDQLNDYLNIKKKEDSLLKRLIVRSRERDEIFEEYEDFKKIFFVTIDTLFNLGKSKIVIRPKSDKAKLYELLLKDNDFIKYYKYEIIGGKEISIEMIEV